MRFAAYLFTTSEDWFDVTLLWCFLHAQLVKKQVFYKMDESSICCYVGELALLGFIATKIKVYVLLAMDICRDTDH